MKGSLARVRRVMARDKPDHAPLFDLLPNDAVLRHFNNGRPVEAGGIDVSYLLPFGTPQQVKDAVIKAIEDTEGQILVGSSTEVTNMVSLKNFLAMREAAMGYRW